MATGKSLEALRILATSLGTYQQGLDERLSAIAATLADDGLSDEEVVKACKLAMKSCSKMPTPNELVKLARGSNASLPPTVPRWNPGERPISPETFDAMSCHDRKLFFDRQRAQWEARLMNQGKPVMSRYFDPEPLGDTLDRMDMDMFGNTVDRDPLGLGSPPPPPEPDTRPRDVIEFEAGMAMRDRIEAILARNARRREESEKPLDTQPPL